MASVQNQVVISSLVCLVTVLVACGKPEIRSKTMDGPSTSANPAKAEAENKAADAKAKEGLKGDASTRAAAEARLAQQKEARRVAILELSAAMKREGVTAAELQKARDKVAEASVGLPPDSDSPAAAAADPAGTAPSAPPAAVGPAQPVTEDPAPVAATSPAPPAVTVPPMVPLTEIELANRRAFVIAMIEPVARANLQIFVTRKEVLRLQAKTDAEKKELSSDETQWLEKVRVDFGGIDEKLGFAGILERVDIVNLSFLAAPLALRSNWVVDTEVAQEKIVQRMFALNTSSTDENVRYRSARLLAKQSEQEDVLSPMRAYLNYTGEPVVASIEKILATVSEIAQILTAEASVKEIDRVSTLLAEEYNAKKSPKP